MQRILTIVVLALALLGGGYWWLNRAPAPKPTNDTLPVAHWEHHTLKKGESLTALFQQLKLPKTTLRTLMQKHTHATNLSHLRAGTQLTLGFSQNHTLVTLHYKLDSQRTLFFEKHTDQQFHRRIATAPMESRIQYASGTIKHSLTASAKRNGVSKNLVAQLERVFSGNIHFDTGLRQGDRYRLLYREFFLNGKPYKTGPLLVAEFENRHKRYRAVRYTDPKHHTAYYTLNGHGVEPLFLARPLHYKRISSRFSYLRFDPYLHKLHSHLGVDFAAPRGTPVRAIGDGKVIFCGRTKGYGNEIIVRFSRKYKALYGHLYHFAHGIHSGKHVHKGQVIGYVGSTGWSTGPHLHFGLYVYGIPRNPLALKLPSGRNVPKAYLADYQTHAKDLLSRLRVHETPAFAEIQQKNPIHED